MEQPVVIVGAGFAGIETAKALGRAGVDTVLIDRKNHHLFQPLLYQVATAALSATEIAEPVRKIMRKFRSVRVWFAEVVGLDTERREVMFADGERLPYGTLILAPGSQPGYFGHDEWEERAPGLKTAEDALDIRSRLLLSFEEAERAADAEECKRLTTFVVIGGGPTGVELAGSIAELARHTLVCDFRNISPESARIILVEGGRRLLPGFDERLSGYAHRRLEKLAVEVRTHCMASEIGNGRVQVGDEEIRCSLVLWAAGVTSSSLGKELGCSLDRSGRVIVDRDLSVPGRPGVFVLGDLAHFQDDNGEPLPGLAQVAKQQGRHLGKALARRFRRNEPLPPFTYRNRGSTAIVGRHAAVFETGFIRLSGGAAWLGWAVVHVYLLAGFQHRITVSIQWLWRYLTYERGARLITGRWSRSRKQTPPTGPDRALGADACSKADGQRDKPVSPG